MTCTLATLIMAISCFLIGVLKYLHSSYILLVRIFSKFQSISFYISISLHTDLIAKFGVFPKNLKNKLLYFEYTKLYFYSVIF